MDNSERIPSSVIFCFFNSFFYKIFYKIYSGSGWSGEKVLVHTSSMPLPPCTSSLSCSPLPSLDIQDGLGCCLSDLPTRQLSPQLCSMPIGSFLKSACLTALITSSIPARSRLWFALAMGTDSQSLLT